MADFVSSYIPYITISKHTIKIKSFAHHSYDSFFVLFYIFGQFINSKVTNTELLLNLFRVLVLDK